jgi:protein-L-isoaspartate(D-aspartate) O-methyltransferase
MNLADKKESLIRNLIDEGYLKSRPVIEAMKRVPRERFVLPGDRDYAYDDHPLPIGSGQTISAPHMVAIMTEELKPGKKDKVLEVGGGSGYQAAILSPLVKKVISTELVEGLIDFARKNLKRAGVRNVRVVQGDGSKGFPDESPYDRIIVSCGSDRVYPAWERQLKEDGIILVPLNRFGFQTLYRITKSKGKLKKERILDCSFVPLRH